MKVWKVIVRPDEGLPNKAQGWALAETEQDALAMVGHPCARAFPSSQPWPGSPLTQIYWSNGKP